MVVILDDTLGLRGARSCVFAIPSCITATFSDVDGSAMVR